MSFENLKTNNYKELFERVENTDILPNPEKKETEQKELPRRLVKYPCEILPKNLVFRKKL